MTSLAYIEHVEAAIKSLQAGKMVILVDSPERENEGDIIFPAETITPAVINFMIRHCSGIICLPLRKALAERFELKYMIPPEENTSSRGTPFTHSIEAREGVTTGVSAQDRATTILTLMNDQAKAEDIVRPGHVFPLIANDEGVLAREGHTEGAVDLVELAGFKPAAVLCEVMNEDGTMANGETLIAFAKTHDITILTIEDLIAYRLFHESIIAAETKAHLPLDDYGDFEITVVKEKVTAKEHIILEKPVVDHSQPVLVRIHSACMTGDLFASQRCDCHAQLHYALSEISKNGGLLIYLNQEGRGIGLFNKISAYALQEKGLDTVEANLALGLPADSRHYHIAASILRARGIQHIRLLTNNPAKLNDLTKYGDIAVTQQKMPIFSHEKNQEYLRTKQIKLKHLVG